MQRAGKKRDICRYVDVFYGSGETDRIFEDGLASKWFYIKALCGNTTPHATLPFGKMSVGAYSGGYPTGYGSHFPNSCGGIRHLFDTPMACGFSHLHQSGTGAIRYYYNYAVVSPFYGEPRDAFEWRALTDEQGEPGYYRATLGGISCELTVDGGVALHRYTFPREGGRIVIDFSNNGLWRAFGINHSSGVQCGHIERRGEREILFSGDFSGVRLYFCVRAEGASCHALFDGETVSECSSLSPSGERFGAWLMPQDRTVLLHVAYSTVSLERAREEVAGSRLGFDKARAEAHRIWEEHLSAIEVESDDEDLLVKFYSNLYHSLVKPADLYGETVLGVAGDVVTDLATLWDQYKTLLPLLYALYPQMGERVVRGIANISRTLGKIPCSFGLSDRFPCEEQARMLGVLTLCDAHALGVRGADASLIGECILRELGRTEYADFLKGGLFERYTHVLDTCDACRAAARIVPDSKLRKQLLTTAERWRGAYGTDGLLSDASPYYEGDRYTYSFRLQGDMEGRVALSGGKARFAEQLDQFFGFGQKSLRQITHVGAEGELKRATHHRFEGFNNECDMETPYSYIFADRHDRLCEIVRECVSRSFGLGRSGLPGNNDSGGLSSLFVWNALGLFPASGRGELLIGAPQMRSSVLHLANGHRLFIRTVLPEGTEQIPVYVGRVTWNGVPIEGWRLPMDEAMLGGELVFYMTDRAEGEPPTLAGESVGG